MTTIAIIPAKGTSSRIPRKNVKLFHGKPIITYSIETAKKSGLFDTVIVSTDDTEISDLAVNLGADVMWRGAEWCFDNVGPLDVAWHHVQSMPDVKLVCVIYATAPLMCKEDLLRGYAALNWRNAMFACSVGNPPLHDAAQFLWCKREALNIPLFEFGEYTVMVPIDSARDCDINTMEDWERAERMYAALHEKAMV